MKSAIEEACNSLIVQSWWNDLHSPDFDTMCRGYTCIYAAYMVAPFEQRTEWSLLDSIANDVLINFHRSKAA